MRHAMATLLIIQIAYLEEVATSGLQCRSKGPLSLLHLPVVVVDADHLEGTAALTIIAEHLVGYKDSTTPSSPSSTPTTAATPVV